MLRNDWQIKPTLTMLYNWIFVWRQHVTNCWSLHATDTLEQSAQKGVDKVHGTMGQYIYAYAATFGVRGIDHGVRNLQTIKRGLRKHTRMVPSASAVTLVPSGWRFTPRAFMHSLSNWHIVIEKLTFKFAIYTWSKHFLKLLAFQRLYNRFFRYQTK
jgi:hypothetical protein